MYNYFVHITQKQPCAFPHRSDAKWYKTNDFKTILSHIKIIIAENLWNYSIFLYRFCELFQKNNRVTIIFAKKTVGQ